MANILGSVYFFGKAHRHQQWLDKSRPQTSSGVYIAYIHPRVGFGSGTETDAVSSTWSLPVLQSTTMKMGCTTQTALSLAQWPSFTFILTTDSIQRRHLFQSELSIVQLLFEDGNYSRVASIQKILSIYIYIYIHTYTCICSQFFFTKFTSWLSWSNLIELTFQYFFIDWQPTDWQMDTTNSYMQVCMGHQKYQYWYNKYWLVTYMRISHTRI